MGIFAKHANKSEYIIIVGCGRLGAHLADTLSDDGKDVLIIDKEEKSFKKLSNAFSGMTMVGDACEMFIRGECNIGKATAVIAVTNMDNTNIMAAQIAKEMYSIKNVIARLYDPDRECVYQEFGIKTICPVIMSTDAVCSMLASSDAD